MKTKDLIAQLQEADPTGEVECCVGNRDIHFVSGEPAYYDGPLQVLIRNEKSKYYNIIGVRITKTGQKVQIHTLSVEDAILNTPDVPVTIEFSDPLREEHIENERKEVKEIIAKLAAEKPK